MTTLTWDDAETGRRSATLIKAGSVATGLAILLARPAIASSLGWSAPVAATLFAVILALGIAAPVVDDRPARRTSSPNIFAVFAAGSLVFFVGRLLAAGHPPAPATGLFVLLNTLAAVSEEALFRRVAFDALVPTGPVAAITGSALLFGLAHVTVYGWWAFPLDVAAGIVLGWQRWASNTWTVPAVTHALADLLVVI